MKCPVSRTYGLEVVWENLWSSWAAGLAGLTAWQGDNRQIIMLLLSPEGCRKHKQYGHEETARTTHPCCFEWKVAPASDTDECSHFSWLDAAEWSIHSITPGWSVWRHYNCSSPVVVCTYWSPQRETNPSAPHQTHSFTSRGRTQASGETCAHANPMRICWGRSVTSCEVLVSLSPTQEEDYSTPGKTSWSQSWLGLGHH